LKEIEAGHTRRFYRELVLLQSPMDASSNNNNNNNEHNRNSYTSASLPWNNSLRVRLPQRLIDHRLRPGASITVLGRSTVRLPDKIVADKPLFGTVIFKANNWFPRASVQVDIDDDHDDDDDVEGDDAREESNVLRQLLNSDETHAPWQITWKLVESFGGKKSRKRMTHFFFLSLFASPTVFRFSRHSFPKWIIPNAKVGTTFGIDQLR
jgi:hypothetical protein